MNTLTLRQIPPLVERNLRKIAHDAKQSLNKTAIQILSHGVGVESEKKPARQMRDVKSVIKPWSAADYKQFELNSALFSKIDKELWP